MGTAVGGGPANLILKVTGVQIGPSFVLPNVTGSWLSWNQAWTSSAGTSYTFEIINANTSVYPNDFYVDDIGLLKAAPELAYRRSGDKLVLGWSMGTLESAPTVSGAWTNVPAASSPYTNTPTAPQQYFRLRL